MTPKMLARLARTWRRAVEREGWLGPARLALRKTRDVVRSWGPAGLRARAAERAFDEARGVDTRGLVSLTRLDVDGESVDHGYRHEPTKPERFRWVMAQLPIRPDDFTFVDI